MAYHKNIIPRGTFGDFCKITEEYKELEDAFTQNNNILELCEMADLIGAIAGYSKKHYNITLDQLVKMTKATEDAFIHGERQKK